MKLAQTKLSRGLQEGCLTNRIADYRLADKGVLRYGDNY